MHYILASTLFETFGISCVMKPAVWAMKFIRSRALIHRQFRTFLKEMDTEYSDLPCTQQLDGSVVVKSYFAFIIFEKK